MALAETLRRQREFDRAESICVGLTRRYPDFFAAPYVLGLIHADRGDYWRAADCLSEAARLNPRSWNSLTSLAGVYVRLDELGKASDLLRRARVLRPNDPATVATLGLARACAAHGRYAEAGAIFEDLWDQGQHTLDILTGLIGLPASVVHKDILAELQNVARNPQTPKPDFDTDIAFVRAAALDKLGRHAEAWHEALTANRAIAANVANELAAERAHRRAKLSALRANPQRIEPAASDDGLPISLFILGPSRSGKTSLETLIATFEGVQRGDENPALEIAIGRSSQEARLTDNSSLDRLPPQFHRQVRKFYAEELARRAGAARIFTNTHPGHIEDAARIAAIIPNARFIFVKRDIDDNVLRIFLRRYKRGNPHSYDLNAAREHVEWYHAMMDELAARLPDIARTVRYEDMVADPPAARRIAAALCGLPVTQRAVPVLVDDRDCAAPYRQFMNAARG